MYTRCVQVMDIGLPLRQQVYLRYTWRSGVYRRWVYRAPSCSSQYTCRQVRISGRYTESPLYSHIKEDPVYLYRVLLDRVHLRLIPPSDIKRAALPERGLLHRPCTGEGGHRDRVSTDPHNQLLYTPPHPYTQDTTSKVDRKSELCWIQQINLIIILALFLHIFRI